MRLGNWLIQLVVSTILSYIGWWLGAFVGIETAFIMSVILGGVGLWYGRRVAYSILG